MRALSLLLVLSACSGQAPPPPAEEDLPDEQPAVTGASLEGAVLVEDLRIGAIDDGPYALAGVWDVAPSPDGAIYALLTKLSEVRVFAADGTYLRTLGGGGRGPGEFSRPQRAFFGPEGRVWISDQALQRFTVFDTAGTVVATHHRALQGDCPIWSTGWMADDGTIYAGDIVLSMTEGGGTLRCRLHRLDDSLRVESSLMAPAPTGRDGPYSPRGVFALDTGTGTVWMGSNDRYRLTRVTFEGDTVAVAVGGREPVSVTGDDLERAEEERARAYGAAGVPTPEEPDPGDAGGHKPYFSHLAVDEEGRLWVAVVGERDGWADRFDVFSREGTFLGTVRSEIPLRVASAAGMQSERYPLRFRDGALYGIWEDDLAVPYIVRLRLRRPDRGTG